MVNIVGGAVYERKEEYFELEVAMLNKHFHKIAENKTAVLMMGNRCGARIFV